MPIYEFSQAAINTLEATTFGNAGLHERRDLQRLLRDRIDVIAPNTLVISEEFGDWEDARRRIDLLAIDKEGNLVVIELKRTDDGGHMDLQAIRYAAMVSKMTFEKAESVFGLYLEKLGKANQDARTGLLEFLGWPEPDDTQFAQSVRIVLASAEFSAEVTTSALWLNEYGIDVRCVRMKAYAFKGHVLVDVQQIIPPPEAAQYQIQLREKSQKERQAKSGGADFTRYDVQIAGERHVGMWKRNALYEICKYLCTHGVSPEEIAALFDWRPTRVWYFVDGQVNALDFEKLASQKAASGGPSFSPARFFCDDGDLVHANGRTYALSNQWGGAGWRDAMTALSAKYLQYNIEFAPTAT